MYHEVNELNYVKTFQNRIGGDGKFQKTSCAQRCAWNASLLSSCTEMGLSLA